MLLYIFTRLLSSYIYLKKNSKFTKFPMALSMAFEFFVSLPLSFQVP